jgi:Cu+-exporting ATPase
MRSLLRLAAAVETGSEHPLGPRHPRQSPHEQSGVNVISAAKARSAPCPDAGCTVSDGRYHRHPCRLRAITLPRRASKTDARRIKRDLAKDQTGTLAWVAAGGRLIGVIGLADSDPSGQTRPGAGRIGAAADLRAIMLTGDNEATARAIAAEAGVSRCSRKLCCRRKSSTPSVIWPGPAADMSPSSETGSMTHRHWPPPISASPWPAARMRPEKPPSITLMRPDLRLVPAALDIAAKTRRTIRQNLGWAFHL